MSQLFNVYCYYSNVFFHGTLYATLCNIIIQMFRSHWWQAMSR